MVNKENNRIKNCCYKCEVRAMGCHSSCSDYKEYQRQNEEMKMAMRLDEAEQHLIENNRKIGQYLANKKKRPKRVGIW